MILGPQLFESKAEWRRKQFIDNGLRQRAKVFRMPRRTSMPHMRYSFSSLTPAFSAHCRAAPHRLFDFWMNHGLFFFGGVSSLWFDEQDFPSLDPSLAQVHA